MLQKEREKFMKLRPSDSSSMSGLNWNFLINLRYLWKKITLVHLANAINFTVGQINFLVSVKLIFYKN